MYVGGMGGKTIARSPNSIRNGHTVLPCLIKMVSRTSLFFLLFFGASLLVKAQKNSDFALKNLAITWQLIDNNESRPNQSGFYIYQQGQNAVPSNRLDDLFQFQPGDGPSRCRRRRQNQKHQRRYLHN